MGLWEFIEEHPATESLVSEAVKGKLKMVFVPPIKKNKILKRVFLNFIFLNLYKKPWLLQKKYIINKHILFKETKKVDINKDNVTRYK